MSLDNLLGISLDRIEADALSIQRLMDAAKRISKILRFRK